MFELRYILQSSTPCSFYSFCTRITRNTSRPPRRSPQPLGLGSQQSGRRPFVFPLYTFLVHFLYFHLKNNISCVFLLYFFCISFVLVLYLLLYFFCFLRSAAAFPVHLCSMSFVFPVCFSSSCFDH